MHSALLLMLVLLTACGATRPQTDAGCEPLCVADEDSGSHAGGDGGVDAGAADAGIDDGIDDGGIDDAGIDGGEDCTRIGDQSLVGIATALTSDEYGLRIKASSVSRTRWDERDNEAVILEVHRAAGLIGHLVLHQGLADFEYSMHLGKLDAGEVVSLKVSPLSASTAVREACVGPAELLGAAGLGSAADALSHAPIFMWPVQKRFDDLPVLVGWSQSLREYQAVYTNENGGTVMLCGGGADGTQALLARWGRACDVERIYGHGTSPSWLRCTGNTAVFTVSPRFEGTHPLFYYGDGHNRLFESRGGYGAACGSGSAEKSDGDLAGWNVSNPGNDAALDDAYTLRLRPLPVMLDPLGYAVHRGRREALVDVHAPWIYRLTFSELEREGKIDGALTLPMERYLFVDVHAADVGGAGDRVCTPAVAGGFVFRARTSSSTFDGPQMTSSFFGGARNWKRLAVPLGPEASPHFTSFVFDAYDNDGIYFLELGDVFRVEAEGDNGAKLVHVRQGVSAVGVYVDDDQSGCTSGVNNDGPDGGSYPCVSNAHELTP